ncbi:MAG: hypothetical protein QM831_38405 [Kofleriaceae bacterium]
MPTYKKNGATLTIYTDPSGSALVVQAPGYHAQIFIPTVDEFPLKRLRSGKLIAGHTAITAEDEAVVAELVRRKLMTPNQRHSLMFMWRLSARARTAWIETKGGFERLLRLR